MLCCSAIVLEGESGSINPKGSRFTPQCECICNVCFRSDDIAAYDTIAVGIITAT